MMATNTTKLEFTPMDSTTTSLTCPEATDLRDWLAEAEMEGDPRRDEGLDWLLATTFTDVVWGLKKDGAWQLSPEGATLPADHLLELRAFGPDAEIFVWRDAAGLRARLRRDGMGDKAYDTYPEEQLLWGTVRPDVAPGEVPPGFTRLAEGDQGLVHEPPLELDAGYFITDEQDKRFGHRPARLVLRHYVEREAETGLARVVDSRLVAVKRVLPDGAKGDESR